MATGKFKLFYTHIDISHPCKGVQYRVLDAETNQVVSSGLTDENGETNLILRLLNKDTSYELEVFNHETNKYEAPDLDGDIGKSSNPIMELNTSADKNFVTVKVRIKPYFKVRFHTQVGNKPIRDAKYTAYLLDAKGKEVIARDLDKSGPIIGKTDANGETGVWYCAAPLSFKFEIPGSPVYVYSPRKNPKIKGVKSEDYEVAFKTIQATTAPEKEGITVKLAGLVKLPLMVSPQDGELIAVPQSDYDEFETMSGLLEQVMANGHRAKLDLSRALESGNVKDIEAAEKDLKLAEDKIKKELNKNFAKLADIKEVMTVERHKIGKNSQTGAPEVGWRRRYLSSDKYLELKNKRLNKKEYKLNIKFGAGPVKGEAGVEPKSLDVKALKESFKNISKELKSSHELFKSDPIVFSAFEEAQTQFSDTILKSETYEVEAHAQWLRFVLGAGASADIDWKKKKAQVQGNFQAKLVLCEGKATANYAFPSLKGWMMNLAGEDLGAIRAVMSCELYGFAGAKLVASGAVGIALNGEKQVLHGIKPSGAGSLAQTIDPKRKLPRFDAVTPYEKMPDDLNGVKADIDVFAGVEAGLTPGGKLEWLPPEEKDFVAFAEVSATVAVSAGAGIGGQVYVFFAKGKFRVKVAGRLCWGVGAKGAVEFTVNANKVLEFARWVHSHLVHAGFRQLVYIDKLAFEALSQLLVYCIVNIVPDGTDETRRLKKQAIENIENFSRNTSRAFDALLGSLELAKTRKAMVENINRKPHWLACATPEVRGMLLYQITRHGIPSHSRDTPDITTHSKVYDPQIHYLLTHKQAVCNIMLGVTSANDWDNVMQHMTARGKKSMREAGKNEGDVLRFLNNGLSLNQDLPSVFTQLNKGDKVEKTGNALLDKYLEKRNKLPGKFAKGYKIARMDSVVFPDDGREHPQFAQIDTKGLGEAYPGDPGTSLT